MSRRPAGGVAGSCALIAVLLLSGCTAADPDQDEAGATHDPDPSTRGSPSSTPVAPISPEVLPGTAGGPKSVADGSLEWVLYADARHARAGWALPRPVGSLGPTATQGIVTDDGWVTSTRWRYDSPAVLSSDGRIGWWTGPRRVALADARGRTVRYSGARTSAPTPPGATLVGSSWSTGDLWWIDTAHGLARPVPPTPHILERNAAPRAPDGRLWVAGWDGRTRVWVGWSDDGGASWTEHLISKKQIYPGGIAIGRSGQVVVFATETQDRHHPRSISVVTRDGGRTWQPFARKHGPQWVSDEGSPGQTGRVTVLPDGTLYVVAIDRRSDGTDPGVLWTATGDWSDLHRAEGMPGVNWVDSNDDLVWAGLDDHRILISDDAGRTWHTVSPR
jgi:hypothetical protein